MLFGISLWQLIVILLYFVPTVIALKKNHPHKIPIILVNIIGGLMMGIGWLVALVWCFIEPAKKDSAIGVVSELEKLHELREKGVISDEEFNSKKKSFLDD